MNCQVISVAGEPAPSPFTYAASMQSRYHIFPLNTRRTECLLKEADEVRDLIASATPMYSQRSYFAHLRMMLEDIVVELLRRGQLFMSLRH